MTPEALIGKTPNLEPPSPTVMRLLTLLDNPETDYDEVLANVRRDVVLSAKLLSLCNSAGFGLAKPVASLDQAVHYLGYCEIVRLVMALNFGKQIAIDVPGYGMEQGALWRHSLSTALLASHAIGLSRKLDLDASIAYTAGLVHDIGKLVIGQMLDAATRGKIQEIVESREASLLEAEKWFIGCDHSEIGACLLRQWHLPEVIVEAVANHHAPVWEGGPRLSAAVHIADVIAHQSCGPAGWGGFISGIHDTALSALCLSSEDLETLAAAAHESEERVARQQQTAA